MDASELVAEAAPGKRPKIFYGWYIVAVSFLCWFGADAFGWYTFGIFIKPITEELGWTTVMLTGALTLRSVFSGLIGPVVGPLADTRHGARVLMAAGVLIAGSVPLAVSRVSQPWQFYLFFGVIGALGMVGFGGLVTNAIISKWFIRLRGRAIGISTMGVSIAGLVFVPMVHSFNTRLGWRTTLVVIGFIIWVLTFLPVVFLVRRRPEDRGLLPDGDEPGKNAAEEVNLTQGEIVFAGEEIWTLKEALKTRALWLLLIGFNTTGLALSGVFLHFYPYVESKGFSSNVAVTALTVVAACCAVVKVPWGLLAERIQVRYCITACYLGCAFSLVILLFSHSVPFVFIYAFTYGVTLGGDMVLRELVWANYYGRTFLGTIRGVIMPANLVSMSGGPLFAAWLKDLTGSYQLPYTIFLITTVLGTLFIYLAKAPEKKEQEALVREELEAGVIS